MLAFNDFVALIVGEIEAVAAYLRTFASVGASAGGGETGLTVAGLADAECAVDKGLERNVDGGCYGGCLLERQFARQHEL